MFVVFKFCSKKVISLSKECCNTTIKTYVRVNSSREHSPRANPGHLMRDESRKPGIWQLIVSRPPGHLQTIKNLFRNMLSSFPTVLREEGFKQSNTVILE